MSSKDKAEQFDPQFPGQRPEEVVELAFHQHPLVMRKELIIGLFAIVLGVLPLDFPQIYSSSLLSGIALKVALGVPVIVFLVWFWRWIGWYYTVYIVTNQRIVAIKQKGFFNRSVAEWQLDKVMNINYEVGGFQAVIFGFGDITVQTVIGDLVIPTVHRPTVIHDKLQEIVRRDVPNRAQTNTMPWLNR